jgi:3-hydroxyacyl-[acyl-carrier-protein] dehydratase
MSQNPALNFDISSIMRFLPHRYPFLLVDRIVECVVNDYVKTYKNVTINEPFFQGHFPGMPIMPGVLIMEALAQSGGLLIAPGLEDVESKLFLFTGMDKVRFRRRVVPGDRLDMHCVMTRHKMQLYKMEAKAFVDGEMAAEAEMTAALVNRKDMLP